MPWAIEMGFGDRDLEPLFLSASPSPNSSIVVGCVLELVSHFLVFSQSQLTSTDE